MKERLDRILVSRGLVKSRELAKALVMEGKVFVDDIRQTKAGTPVSEDSNILLKEPDLPYVSRGGLKLQAALDHFGIDVTDRVCMDVGSSTGGFTDCLLQRGAKKVYCIDVGYGQLAWSLRKDPRAVLMERTNVRYLDTVIEKEKFSGYEFEELRLGRIMMAAIDVSFISLAKVVPTVLRFLVPDGEILALVKPQFEVGKGKVGKGGVVRDHEKRVQAVRDVQRELEASGLKTVGIFQSPVTGQKGNIEYFLYMKR